MMPGLQVSLVIRRKEAQRMAAHKLYFYQRLISKAIEKARKGISGVQIRVL